MRHIIFLSYISKIYISLKKYKFLYIVGWVESDGLKKYQPNPPTRSDQPKDLGWVELGQFRQVDGFDTHLYKHVMIVVFYID